MAFVTMDLSKLRTNYGFLDRLFKENEIKWSVVTKILCGNRVFLNELLNFGVTEVCDSRISNLRTIKLIKPDVTTIYIKPPAKRHIRSIVQHADISMNTELETIKLLGAEAARQNKVHKIIIMIEMGELREGVIREDLIDFYGQVLEIENIEVVGIGTNLACLYGVLPNTDKLLQLSLFQQIMEAKFDKKIEYISGGSSVTIPLIFLNQLPKGVNHFRVGESLFMGTDVYNDSTLEGMEGDVFMLYSEIIELIEKPVVPSGDMGTNVDGHSFEFSQEQLGETSYRALIDIGLLDVDEKHITPVDDKISIVGGSSDMFVIDLGDNPQQYKVGDLIPFKLSYMGTVRILNSRYIDKRIRVNLKEEL